MAERRERRTYTDEFKRQNERENTMRRHFAGFAWLLLIVMLMVPMAPSVAAKQEKILLAAELGSGNFPLSGFEFLNDNLYFVSKDVLYLLKDGDTTPSAFPLEEITGGENDVSAQTRWQLLKDRNTLYLLNLDRGLIYPLDVSKEQPLASQGIQLMWDSYERDSGDGNSYTDPPSIYCPAGDWLYVQEQERQGKVAAFSLQDGKRTEFQSEGIELLAPYKDSRLLVLLGGDMTKSPPEARRIGIFDPANDTVTPVRTISENVESPGNIFGLQYDADLDILYIGMDQQITRYPARGEGEVCALLPPVFLMQGGMRLAGGGYCAIASTSGLLIRSLDPQVMNAKKTLTVWGSVDLPALYAAALSLPEVNIKVAGMVGSDTLEQRLIYGDTDIDVFRVSLPFTDFPALLQKGYFYDLSGSAEITALHQALYPIVRQALEMNGKIAAIPINATLWNVPMYDTGFFAETGEKIPETFEEMCALIQSWSQKYQERYPDLTPLSVESARRTLLYAAINLYQEHMQQSKQTMTFDSALLRNMLSAAEEAAAAVTESKPTSETYASPVFSIGEPATITNYHGEARDGRIVKPLPLAPDSALTPLLCMNLEVLLINPRSLNKETAMRFIESAAAALPQITRVMLCPEENTPVLNSYFDQELKNFENMLAATAQQAEKAQGSEKTDAEKQLATLKKRLEQFRETEQYALAQEDILAYRNAMDSAYVNTGSFHTSLSEAIRDIANRYADGQINGEQFILEAEGKLKLIQNESE